MTAERDSMTLNEVSVPALGVEERSDEAPRAGRARPTPDPEVVAKPKRRQFTAEYRLRILEEADRCTQPGEVGRLLRREGLYSSHLTAWRKARRKGSLRELAAKKRGRETGRTQPAGCEGARARGASGSPGARVAHRAHDPGRAGKSCRAAGIEPRTRNALLIAVQPLAAQVGVAPACQALGVSRASFYRRQRSTPGHQQPRPTPARALCEAEREQILDVLAGPRFVDRAPAEVVATLLDEGHYLCSERTMYRILAADQPVRERRNQREHPQYTKPELVATAPNQTLVLGHHQAVGADQVDVLLPLRRARHLQPLRGRLDGRRPGELGAGRSSHRRDLPQPGRPAPGAHPALRPRRADDEQVHRTTARRPRRDPFTEPPSGVRRQPLLRGAVQDPEVPPRLPWPLPRHHRRNRLLPNVLPLVQHRTSPWRDRDAHPGRRPSQSNPERAGAARADPSSRLDPSSRTLRPRDPTTASPSPSRLDQPT